MGTQGGRYKPRDQPSESRQGHPRPRCYVEAVESEVGLCMGNIETLGTNGKYSITCVPKQSILSYPTDYVPLIFLQGGDHCFIRSTLTIGEDKPPPHGLLLCGLLGDTSHGYVKACHRPLELWCDVPYVTAPR